MPQAAFETYSATSGRLQFSSLYAPLHLIGTQAGTTVASVYSAGTGSQSSITFNYGGNTPCIAFRCSVPFIVMCVYGSSGNYAAVLEVFGPVGTPVGAYIFDNQPPSHVSGANMELYDDTGRLTFSLALRPMKVKAKLTSLNFSDRYIGDPSKYYACMVMSFFQTLQITNTGFGTQPYLKTFRAMAVTINDSEGSVALGMRTYQSNRSASNSGIVTSTTTPLAVVVEVTNY